MTIPAATAALPPAAAPGQPAGGRWARVFRLDRSLPPAPEPASLDDQQRAVVEHAGGPLLVLAGPGTGKTATLVEAVAHRVAAGVPLESVLVLTFSRRAAQELRERITTRVGAAVGAPVAWTFHAWCFAVLRAFGRPDEPAPRLLTDPERFARLRDLIDGSRELGRPRWPASLAACLRTRGFAEEVEALFARVRELGLGPADLAELGRRTGRDDWLALAQLQADYLDNLGWDGSVDYPELGHRVAELLTDPEIGPRVRARYGAVFVDEYQDTDPARERVLALLAEGGADLVAFGDPDQSMYAFRGARVRELLGFPARFRQADGSPAPVLTLNRCRRMAPAVLAASREVAARLPVFGLPAATLRAHRALVPTDPDAEGQVEALIFPTEAAETEAIADLLRREHLLRGVPWRQMAVLARSARALAPVARALAAAGVPVDLAGDEPPLAERPAAALLLTALRVAAEPATMTAADARSLLLSPLGGAHQATLRALGRALREAARAAAGAGTPADGGQSGEPARLETTPPPSAELIRDAVADPGTIPADVPTQLAAPAVRVGWLLRAARARLADGGSPHDALWELWDSSGWRERLTRAAAGAGSASRSADADLAAVVALFDAVERLGERRGPGFTVASLVEDLRAQEFAADDRAGPQVRPDAVRLLTVHRAKGMEWDVVAVRGVQDGVWPDLRPQHSLLGAELLDGWERGGLRPPDTPTDRWAQERRLFYVAVTRARRRLVVTAVDAAGEDGSRPSALVGELGVRPRLVAERPARPLTLVGLVATLRQLAADQTRSPALRAAARRRLAALALLTDRPDRPLVPAAHPDRWWGIRELTESDTPVVPPGEPIYLSGSSLASLRDCALRWFLEHEAHAGHPATTAQSFGRVVHALADEVTSGRAPADLAGLDARLDAVWRHLAFDATWRSDQERAAARDALARFLDWHAQARGRVPIGSEIRFSTDLTVDGRPVRLRGSIDRIELDDAGRVHIIDFKTGRSAVAARDLAEHAQLGTYQLAVREGALDEHLDRARPSEPPAAGEAPASTPAGVQLGGAELVHLRRDADAERTGPRAPGEPPGPAQVQAQEPLPAGRTWIDDLLGRAVHTIATETFTPTVGPGCDYCTFRRACPAQHTEGRQVVE